MGGHAGGAYPAIGATKISDRLAAAFTSPAHPMILDAHDFASGGVVDPFEHRKYLPLAPREPGPPHTHSLGEFKNMPPPTFFRPRFQPIILRGYSHTIFLKPDEGDDPRRYYNEIYNNPDARFVVLTTFGSFTANSKVRNAIMEAARETGKQVLAANPFPEGKLDHEYDEAKKLRAAGVIPTAILPIALAAKLLLAQRVFGENPEKILEFITKNNYVGEQPPAYWFSFCKGLITQHETDPQRKIVLQNAIRLDDLDDESRKQILGAMTHYSRPPREIYETWHKGRIAT